jgi:hypothetical protein
VVRINHGRSCLLCHAPADGAARESEVRVDVTYLRQDFWMMLPVENAGPSPRMQRFDFLIRKRTLTAQEAEVYREALHKATPGSQSSYRRAVLAALRRLTGHDAGTTSAEWRQMLDLPAREQPVNQP